MIFKYEIYEFEGNYGIRRSLFGKFFQSYMVRYEYNPGYKTMTIWTKTPVITAENLRNKGHSDVAVTFRKVDAETFYEKLTNIDKLKKKNGLKLKEECFKRSIKVIGE